MLSEDVLVPPVSNSWFPRVFGRSCDQLCWQHQSQNSAYHLYEGNERTAEQTSFCEHGWYGDSHNQGRQSRAKIESLPRHDNSTTEAILKRRHTVSLFSRQAGVTVNNNSQMKGSVITSQVQTCGPGLCPWVAQQDPTVCLWNIIPV